VKKDARRMNSNKLIQLHKQKKEEQQLTEIVRTAALLIGLTIPFTAVGTAFAAHPLITDDTGTLGKGRFQLEASGSWLTDQEDVDSGGMREITKFATTVFAAGIAETLDLMIGVPYVWTETKETGMNTKASGLFDSIIEAKWRFYNKQKLGLVIKPGILLPTGEEDKGLGTGRGGYSAVIILTVDAEPWAFDANLGYLYLPNRPGERSNIWLVSLASRFAVAERWKIVGEIGATRNTDPVDNSNHVFGQVGLIYSPKDYLDLSAGFLAGLNDEEVDQSARVGVTIRF
jgi:hypothetical protein